MSFQVTSDNWSLTIFVCDRNAMMSFIRCLDIDYKECFSCPICSVLPHDELVLIMDGKEMGMKKALAKQYIPPCISDDDPVAVEW
jgi:hypothetical protein